MSTSLTIQRIGQSAAKPLGIERKVQRLDGGGQLSIVHSYIVILDGIECA